MEELGSIFPKALKKQTLHGKQPVVQILAPLWPRVVGRFISQVSEPVWFDEGTLFVTVSSAAWAAQLQAMTDPLRAQINNYLGVQAVRKLRIRLKVASATGLRPAAASAHRATQMAEPVPDPIAGPMPDIAQLLWKRCEVKPARELADVVERSFIKYFSRNGNRIKT